MNNFIISLCIVSSLMLLASADCSGTITTPVHRYWSESRQNSLYVPSIDALPGKLWQQAYVDEGVAFHVLNDDCFGPGTTPLYLFKYTLDMDSILTTKPENVFNRGYEYVGQVGRCFTAEKYSESDNEAISQMVPMQTFFSYSLVDHLYKTDREEHDIMDEIDGYNYQGIECYVSSEPLVTEQVPQSSMDVIFILDSSGSVAFNDDDLSNWKAEIDFVAAAVRDSLPVDSRIGLINFSGCGPKVTFEDCQKQNKLKLEWGLTDFSTKEQVLARIASMGPDDFNAGFTWTDEALSIALEEFEDHSSKDRSKMIVLLTDGEPYPYNEGHEPCKTSTNYVSETVTALKELRAKVVTVAINSNDMINEYFLCMSDDFEQNIITVDDFDALSEVVTDIDWTQRVIPDITGLL